ncbi:NitT/TauT family transport system permease protein [Desulfitispora alkaliphila]|uniref:ABC transporter permease n=1 Tax=Desulfitispora alkaliphila TaxID=622674 RepID=UPI003D2634F5
MMKTIRYIASAFTLFFIWHVVAVIVDRNVLPTPIEAIEQFIHYMSRGLLQHFFISTYRVVVSLCIAFILAVPLGFLMGRNSKVDDYLAPMVYMLYPLPKSVFLPLLVVFFGLGDLPKILLITIIVFFQILVTSRDAAKGVPEEMVLSMKSLNASQWQIYRHVIWPSSLPKILTAVRISLGTAVAVLFLAETFASITGLGYFIMDSMGRQAYSRMFAGIMGMGILGLGMYLITDWIENKYCKWQK